MLQPAAGARPFDAPEGHTAVLAGSCSAATRGQVKDAIDKGVPAFGIDPVALAEGRLSAAEILAWATPRLAATPVLVYSTAEPEAVRAVQRDVEAGASLAEAMSRQPHAFNPLFTHMVAAGEAAGGSALSAGLLQATRTSADRT